MTRAERLNDRFRLIQKALEKTVGRDKMFAAAAAGWLMAIQYGAEQSMKQIGNWATADNSSKGFNSTSRDHANEMIQKLDAEHEAMLRKFHEELCFHLNVDPVEALELSKHFGQIVHDICFQGG